MAPIGSDAYDWALMYTKKLMKIDKIVLGTSAGLHTEDVVQV